MEKDPDLTDAMNYLNKVKEEYKDDITTYDHFLELMRDYKNGKNDAMIIIRAVEQLFKGKKFLIDKFQGFLPQCMHEAINMKRYNNNYERYERTPYYERQERVPIDRPLERPLERVPLDRPLERPLERVERPSERPNFDRPERMVDRHDRIEKYPNERFDRFADRNISERQFVPEMNKEKQQLPFYFEDTHKQKRALQFVHKVKKRFLNTPEAYKEFIRVLQIYQKNPSNADKILNQLKNLLSGHEDLLRDFVHFIPNNLSFINEILKQKDLLQPFTKLLNMYNQNCISPKDFLFLMKNILSNDRLLNALANFINYKVESDEIVVKNLKKIGSYRVLPEELRNVECLDQDYIAKAVLNNFCMSCAFGSEETTFLSSKKNAYEEVLYRIEDERYECELNIFRISDFIVNLEELFERLMTETKKDKEGSTEDDNYVEFTVDDINMPAGIIQDILAIVYRDKAIDIMEGILTKPQISIPIVLKRLYLVCNRMKKEMNDKNKLWRDITIKNVYKANEYSLRRERTCERYEVNCLDDFIALYNEYSNVVNMEGKDIFLKIIEIIKDQAHFSFYASSSLAGAMRLILEVCECLFSLQVYFENFKEGKNKLADTNDNHFKEGKIKDISDEREMKKMDVEDKLLDENKNMIIEGENKMVSHSTTTRDNIVKRFLSNKEKDENKMDVEGENKELSKAVDEDESKNSKTKKDVFYDASNGNTQENLDTESSDHDVEINNSCNKDIPKKLGLLPPEEFSRNDITKKDYNYVLTLIKNNLTGDSDNQTYEDTLRLITDSRGQRLYNIEKVMLKIDRYCNSIKTEEGTMQLLEHIKRRIGRYAAEILCDNEKLYLITKKDYIQIEEMKEGDEELKDVVRFFVDNDERDDSNVYTNYGLEIVVDKNYKIKYVENTSDFVMRKGKKRMLNCEKEK